MCHGCILKKDKKRFMPGLVSTGFKRKHDALEEDEGKDCPQPQAYTMQRQSVLNISICKLKTTRALIEPSLRRSVLICNTLRQIEQELRAEGRHFDSTHLSMIIANQSVEENTDEEIISPPTSTDGSNSGSSPLVLNCQRTQELCIPKECIYSRKDENSASAPTDLLSRTMCGCSTCLSSNPRLTSTTISITSTNHHSSPKVHSLGTKDSNLRLPSKQNSTSAIVESGGVFNTLPLDVLDPSFGDIDIDIAMYDFDLNSPVVVNPKPTSATLQHSSDEWLRSLMGDISTTLSATTNNDSSQQIITNSSNNCRSDLADELDQIMHVLVDVGM